MHKNVYQRLPRTLSREQVFWASEVGTGHLAFVFWGGEGRYKLQAGDLPEECDFSFGHRPCCLKYQSLDFHNH